MKAYIAGAMTGLTGEELINRSKMVKKVCSLTGIIPLDPVVIEAVKRTKKPLKSTPEAMVTHWSRDKEMIREADVVFDITPERKSEGVSHELGYARYYLWKPIIRVYMSGGRPSAESVAYFEDDVLVDNLLDACLAAKLLWGTRLKRFKWRLRMYQRCRWKALKHELGGWK